VTVYGQKEMEVMATEHYTELLGEPVGREFTLNLGALDRQWMRRHWN
jgi:hypothetical protein